MNKQSNGHGQSGFTLIELSIVLVIIGLIVGGVLVGQNLIKSAELRSTITQIESLNTSVNTFRGKFGGLPGDCNNCFSTFSLGSADGDADGLLESDTANNRSREFDQEISNFFAMLSSANMIAGNYVAGSGASVTVGTHFPASKHGRGGIFALASDGFNHYVIGAQTGNGVWGTTGASATNMMQNTLTPEEAYQLDQKTDDSLPASGTTRAVQFTAGSDGMDAATAAAAATTTCVLNTATPNPYHATNTTPACQLMFRAN